MTQTNTDEQDSLLQNMLGDFLDESDTYLQSLNENLLKLDQWVNGEAEDQSNDQDLSILQEMFRAAHSLKGLSAMLGLSHINELTHKVENVFDAARNRELPVTSNAVELIFQAVDLLSEMVDTLKTDGNDNVNCESVVKDIGTLLQSAGVEKERTNQADADRSFEECLQNVTASANQNASETEELTEQAPTEEMSLLHVAPSFDDVSDDLDFESKYFAIFLDETQLSIESLTDLLIKEGEPLQSDDLVEQLLIISHRIKGSAASVGLNRAAKFAHCLEDLLQDMANAKQHVTPELADSILECIDVLRTYIDSLKLGQNDSVDFETSAKRLFSVRDQLFSEGRTPEKDRLPLNPEACQSTSTSPATTTSSLDLAALVGSQSEQLKTKAPLDRPGFFGAIEFQDNLPLSELKALLAYEKLAQLGQVFYCNPSPEQFEKLDPVRSFVFGLVTEAKATLLHEQVVVEGLQELYLSPIELNSRSAKSADASLPAPVTEVPPAGPTPKPSAKESTPQKAVSKPIETVRVDIDRLDQLMNLAGQLVINKARFGQISDGLKQMTSGIRRGRNIDSLATCLSRFQTETSELDGDQDAVNLDSVRVAASRIQSEMESFQGEFSKLEYVRNSVNEMLDAVHQLERISDGIQKCVMDTRMVPIGPLFGRFKRVIRDITRSNKKEITLEIGGEKTELDKRMIDELGDPLIHMVRNSADHGIESPEAREAAGKPRRGTVSLDAFHRGNSIVIRVSDDGKGLDAEMIRRKAIDKGIVSEAETEKMTPLQIYQLIWEPGFSTAEQITEVSGRGMGMDIVRSKIEDINGTIELDSEPGKGTTITIKLPLTLAILPSLLADIEGDVFALPVESVVEIVQLQDRDFATAHGQKTARVRERIVSVVDLNELFVWNATPRCGRKSSDSNNEGNILVIIGNEGKEVGLVVDALLGEEDIVIKSLAENYRNVDGIAGASILGDGRVSLILDARALLELSFGRALLTSVN